MIQCKLNDCYPGSECSIIEGEIHCGPCPSGYEGNAIGPNGCTGMIIISLKLLFLNLLFIILMLDVNEWARNTTLCNDLNCINTPGSYECNKCQIGYHGPNCEGKQSNSIFVILFVTFLLFYRCKWAFIEQWRMWSTCRRINTIGNRSCEDCPFGYNGSG